MKIQIFYVYPKMNFFYISVVEEVSFRRRFVEMIGILGVVSLISYGIGIALRATLGD